MRATALYHTAPNRVELREISLPALQTGQLLLKTRFSAISPGTESMLFRGQMPTELQQDETIQSLQGGFAYPFSYGYALVGEVVETGPGVDPLWNGRQVFAFHPHQDRAVVSRTDCLTIPEDISPQAALFLPHIESALNFIMDARPGVGEKVMVFGQGVVGLLTTALLAEFPLSLLISADPLAYRREKSLHLGAMQAVNPLDPSDWNALKKVLFEKNSPDGLDLAVELSGRMEALDQAIDLTGFSGRIVVGSWYGKETAPLHLGGHFHRRRIQLLSSQVSTVNPPLSGRWSKERRIALAWEMIRKINPQGLITHRFPLSRCQQAFELLARRLDDVLQVILTYP